MIFVRFKPNERIKMKTQSLVAAGTAVGLAVGGLTQLPRAQDSYTVVTKTSPETVATTVTATETGENDSLKAFMKNNENYARANQDSRKRLTSSGPIGQPSLGAASIPVANSASGVVQVASTQSRSPNSTAMDRAVSEAGATARSQNELAGKSVDGYWGLLSKGVEMIKEVAGGMIPTTTSTDSGVQTEGQTTPPKGPSKGTPSKENNTK